MILKCTLPPIVMEVKKGPSNSPNSSYLSNIAIFHGTMITGEKVKFRLEKVIFVLQFEV